MIRTVLAFALWLTLGLQTARTAAEEIGAAERAFFEARIRPVLLEHCYGCHSAEAKTVQGGLRLDTRAGLLRGGDSGPAVVPGEPEESLLLAALRYESFEMPPTGRLPEAVIADFSAWIGRGAADPRDGIAGAVASAPTRGAVELWTLAPPRLADPPAVGDQDWAQNPIDRFIRAGQEAAGVRPVPRAAKRTLLRRVSFDLIGLPPTPEQTAAFLADDSPDAYARVVDRLLASPHFGERWGRHWMDVARYADSVGGGGNFVFENAWRYRDWIIQSINEDKPYDRFLVEQVAGDLLPADDPRQRSRQVIATGFLAIGRKELPEYDKEKLRMDVVDEQIDTLGQAVLGLSLGCARCHDHKFDPVTTADYYALAGIFESTETLAERRSGPHSSWLQIDLPDGSGRAIVVRDAGIPVDSRVRIRGDAHNCGTAVPRGFVRALCEVDAVRPVGGTLPADASGRLELARWVASPENPLTARVMVNRIWHWLFGRGIVATPNDFGTRGAAPTHPELLDWLAVRFVRDEWSIKRMVRRIVLSRTYQLSSCHDEAAEAIDPENRLWWRHERRRLDAEIIRDAMLHAAGRLDPTQFGNTLTFTGRLDESQEKPTGADPWRRRSVYLPRYREDKQIDVMQAFDAAHPALVTGSRASTTVPTQALYLMNSPFVLAQSQAMAHRLLARTDLTDGQRIDLAYQWTFSRAASDQERLRDQKFLSEFGRVAALGRPDGSLAAAPAAWAGLCHTLLASNEFLFID